MYNIKEERLKSMFNIDPVDVWINSFGGCRSNYIFDSLEGEYNVYNQAYELKGCHYIKPLDVTVGSGIFCYVEDVGIALSSQLKRDMKHNFDKLMEEPTEFSIDKWLDGINEQIDNWTNNPYFVTFIINTDTITDYTELFEDAYGVKLKPYKKRSTNKWAEELKEHKEQILTINKKLERLPDFTYKIPDK